MPLFNKLLGLFENAEMIRDQYTGISITEILNWINTNPDRELRFYVDGTPNFGHQASTINLMKRIIDKIGYNQAIRIVYSNYNHDDPERPTDTPAKLAILLAGLNPANIDNERIAYGTCNNIRFINYEDRAQLPQLDADRSFGFTGGADDMATNFAVELKVAYFLRAQPYLWDDAMDERDDEYFQTSRVEMPGPRYFYLADAYENFLRLAYKFPRDKFTEVSDEVWTWYGNTQNFDANLKLRVNNIRVIYNKHRANANLQLWPLYGLHQFTARYREDAQFNELPSIAMNFVLAAFQRQLTQGRPVIIFGLNKPEDTSNAFMKYLPAFQQDLQERNQDLRRLKAAIQVAYARELAEDYEEDDAVSQANIDSFIARLALDVRPLIDANCKLTLFLAQNNGSQNISIPLGAAIDGMANNEVIVVLIGAAPMDVYNYFYANCQFPGVFEGQGTSSLVISLGRPFIQLIRDDQGIANNYPSTLAAANYDAISITANEASLALRDQQFISYIKREQPAQPAEYYNGLANLFNFIRNVQTVGTQLNNYFTRLGTYYQKDIHDKAMLGLVAVDSLILGFDRSQAAMRILADAADVPITLEAGTKLTLQQVYDQLISSWSDGAVNLINALPKTYFTEFFKAVSGDTFMVKVEKSNITNKSENAQIVEVEMKAATTNAFNSIGIPSFNIGLIFTAPNGVVVTQIKTSIDDTWSIDGIPWIGLQNPGFEMTVNEGGIPVKGGLTGTVKNTNLKLNIVYPTSEDQWLITGSFEKDYPGISSFYQMAGGIDLTQQLPAPLSQLAGFGLKKVQLMYNSSSLKFDYMTFEMTTQSPWTISETPLFQITPTVHISIYNVQDVNNRKTEFLVTGEFKIASGTITVNGGFPNFELYGGLTSGKIMLSDLLALFGGEVSLTTAVTGLSFAYKPQEEFYQLGAALEDDKPLNIADLFSINKLSFNVQKSKRTTAVSLGGEFTILPESEKIGISVQASYATNAGWTFMGMQTSSTIKVGKLLTYYIDPTWSPAEGKDLEIDGVSFQIATKTKDWEFTAKTAKPWEIDFLDLSIAGKALIGYGQTNSDDPAGYYGKISADIVWFGIEINVFYNFNHEYKSYGIQWENLTGKVENNIVTLTFKESITIGSMVETMVGWATGSKFSLGAPWNILDSITLNKVELTFNFTDNKVGLEIDLDPIEIGLLGINIATITGFKLTYASKQEKDEDNGVKVELLGTFVWPRYDEKTGKELPKDAPLGWDASKPETTPAPSALGNKYIDLRLLAMGQHVEVAGLASAPNVPKAIEAMSKLAKPEKGKIPPITVKSENGWLVGLDMGLLRIDPQQSGTKSTLTKKQLAQLNKLAATPSKYVFNLQIVFSDPDLYGLHIKLDGDAAKVFKGLEFEIMYRQVSQSVGVYQSEVTLPDIMRYIRMGQFNITLPVFGIQVYTNGDFQVDLGFPWNSNFARSFTLQTIIYVPVPIPVMGSIGIYFAKLSSATTTKVPTTSKGIFNPVVAFGVGFQIGLGYDFNIGILSAGFQLTAFAIIEGVIAKWNPFTPVAGTNDNRIENEYYFAIKGTLGVIGKLYGSVDFAIIQASVNIDIRIMAQFYFAPYEPIEIALVASVTASASIKILFIRISFSFSLRIEHHLTLPSTSEGVAPWADGSEKISLSKHRRLQRAALHSKLVRLHLKQDGEFVPKWDNLIKAATPNDLKSYIMFAVAVSRDENEGEGQPKLSNQLACGVSMLLIDSVKAPQEDFKTCMLKAADANLDTAFEILAKQVFRWMIAAMQDNALTEAEVDELIVSRDDFETMLAYLNDKTRYIPIPEDAINTFMSEQFRIKVSDTAADADATYFPMAPDMAFSIKGTNYTELSYAYKEYNACSENYLEALRAYFTQLAAKTTDKEIKHYKNFVLDDAKSPSIASFIFTDYYALIAKQMMQMAINSLKNFIYIIQAGQKCNDIVNWVNTTGDFSSYSLEHLFEDNKEHKLTTDKILIISGLHYVVQSGNTFSTITTDIYANTFSVADLVKKNSSNTGILNAGCVITYPGKDDQTILSGESIDNIVKAFEGITIDELISNSNLLSIANLLIAPATLALPDMQYKTKENDTINSICAAQGTNIETLASVADNGDIIDLFATTDDDTLNIVQIPQFKVSELIKEIQYTQGLQHLAGLTSRYYLAGLRLPTQGITPKYPGMWVTGQEGAYTLPPAAGLFALTGQQVPLVKLSEAETLTLTYTNYLCNWIIFEQGSPLSINLTSESVQNKQISVLLDYATKNYLDTDTSELGTQELFTIEPSTYTFNSAVSWISPSRVTMPYASDNAGIQNLKLWKIPDSLLNLPDLSVHKINPYMDMHLGTYDEASQTMQEAAFDNYAWGARVDFSIKKVSPLSGSPTSESTYEVAGTDGFNTLLLEKMVDQIKNNESLISSLSIAYTQNNSNTMDAGIQTDDANQIIIGMAQVNLTTVTQPPQGNNFGTEMLADTQQNLTSPADFIRLLWEASITQQGGYYLYYHNTESNTGLPDRIFDSQGDAVISLVVLFSNKNANQVCSYMNVLATAAPVDFSNHTLFARSLKRNWSVNPDDNSLNDIAKNYFADIDDVVNQNKTLPLRNGAVISIQKGLYKVGAKAPGGDLNTIANYFGTTAEAIKTANPQITFTSEPLPVYTALYLPEISLTIDDTKGRNTFGLIAQYYNTTLTELATSNQNVTGIFRKGTDTEVQFFTGPLMNKATVAQGEMAVEGTRLVPPAIPDNPDTVNYAQIYLKNNFSLLGYRVAGNAFFDTSNMAVPLSPVIKGVSSTRTTKFIKPPLLLDGDLWTYKDSLPYINLVKKIGNTTNGLPDGEKSPYKGMGSLLQIEYNWQDLYGNSLLTTLDNPENENNLNKFPILIQYTDSLVALSRWPSVSSNWQVVDNNNVPEINMILNFDIQAYNGLLKVIPDTTNNTIKAIFTVELDTISAENKENYSFDNDAIIISGITLDEGNKAAIITLNTIPTEGDTTLRVENIFNKDKSKSYTGTATFSTNAEAVPNSSLIKNAIGDRILYEKIWYQLTDESGVKLQINTSLLPDTDFVLNAEETNLLVQEWIASIYKYVADRANGNDMADAPDAQHSIHIAIDTSKVETKDIFRLNLNFSIKRIKSNLASSSAPDITESVTLIAPMSSIGSNANDNYSQFITDFETVFKSKPKLRVASGVDRFESQISGSTPLWVVRVDTADSIESAIGYKINNDESNIPQLFAPRPVSNQLISKTQVPIYPFNKDTGIDKNTHINTDFINTDINLWCRQIFENFDDLLSPEYTAAIQIVDYKNSPNTTYFDTLTKQKGELADIIKQLMVPVFKGENWETQYIRESFKQILLVRLSNAYNVKSGLQFSAKVFENNIAGPANLFGNITQSGDIVKNIQFTSPKLGLQPSENIPFNFLLSAPEIIKGPNGEVLPSLALNLNYTVNAIEHQIGSLDGIEDYKASTWLKFFSSDNPLLIPQSLHNGAINVPLPLNVFPDSPSLTKQYGSVSANTATSLSDLLNWDYQFTYSLTFHYPQDIMHFSIMFNTKTGDGANLKSDLKDSFNAIAEMITVLPDMKNAFENLAKIDMSSDSASIHEATVALDAYTELIDDIIKSSNNGNGLHVAKKANNILSAEGPYIFSIKEGTASDGALLVSVLINETDKNALGGVPVILIEGYETITYSGGDCEEGYVCYYFKDDSGILPSEKGQKIQKRTVTLDKLNILARQDVSATGYMDRNLELVSGKETNEQFVFTTGEVTFPNYYYPNFIQSTAVNIASIPTGKPVKASLAQHLNNLFISLLDKNSQTSLSFNVVVTYNYSINALNNQLQLPVMMQPLITFTLSDPHKAPDDLIVNWTEVINTWLKDNLLNTNNASLNFNLSIFSDLTQEPKPLIQLSSLYVDIADIQ